jgi:hypothetical protein
VYLLTDNISQEGMAVDDLIYLRFLMFKVQISFAVTVNVPSVLCRTFLLLSSCMCLFISIEMVYSYPRSVKEITKKKKKGKRNSIS